jgi:hypothetical protein
MNFRTNEVVRLDFARFKTKPGGKFKKLYVYLMLFSSTTLAQTSNREIICSAGTELAGKPWPQGLEQWCERTDSKGLKVKHGPFETRSMDGKVSVSGQYRDGKKDGKWTEGDSSGNYRDGLREGEWKIYWDGAEESTEIYRNGKVITRTQKHSDENE